VIEEKHARGCATKICLSTRVMVSASTAAPVFFAQWGDAAAAAGASSRYAMMRCQHGVGKVVREASWAVPGQDRPRVSLVPGEHAMFSSLKHLSPGFGSSRTHQPTRVARRVVRDMV